METVEQIIARFPRRAPDAHKGDLGHVFVIAGASGYTGAAYLASQAAILSGSGLVTLGVGKSIYPILAAKLTEVMVRPFFETKDASLSLMAEKELLAFIENCTTVALGPGISQNKETQILARNIARKCTKPIVIDADGLNAFVGHVEELKSIHAPHVLTPHPGEMSRLIGKETAEVQANRKDIALGFAHEYNTVLVLKGHQTVVASPSGECYINETGNAGMASGGVGDVLTGIIAGFIAQGLDIFGASVLGAHFHGLAGDLAAREKGMPSLIATDLLNKLPETLKTLA